MRVGEKFFLCILVVLLCSITHVSAHPGRTDANGGHYNRTTGEYHYHHGYPEHQHENGICPYDFDDRTNRNSNNHSSSSSSSTKSHIYRTAPSEKQDASPRKKQDISHFLVVYFTIGLWGAVIFCLRAAMIFCGTPVLAAWIAAGYYISMPIIIWNDILPFVTYSVWYFIIASSFLTILNIRFWYNNFINKKKDQENQEIELYRASQKQLRERIDQENRELKKKEQQLAHEQRVLQQRLLLIQKYAKPISQLCDIPSGIAVGKDGLPYEIGKPDWGELYTVYRSDSGKAYHRKGCNGWARTPVHILVASRSLAPCKICKPEMPDVRWLKEYHRIMKIQYKIKHDAF